MHPMPIFDDWTGPTPQDEDVVIDAARKRVEKTLDDDVANGRPITEGTKHVAWAMFMTVERGLAEKGRAEREAIVSGELDRIFELARMFLKPN